MSGKNKFNRTKREARQEKQAKNVIKWLSIALLVCAIIWMIVALNVQKDIISKEFDTKITKNQLNTSNLVIYSCKHATTRTLKKGS